MAPGNPDAELRRFFATLNIEFEGQHTDRTSIGQPGGPVVEATSYQKHVDPYQRTMSLRALMWLVTCCALFCGAFVHVSGDVQRFLVTWSLLVLGHMYWTFLVLRRLTVPRRPRASTAQQSRTQFALRMTCTASVVPTVMWLWMLFSGGGGSSGIAYVIYASFLFLIPVAVILIFVAFVFLVRGQFDVGILFMQITALCAVGWPFFYVAYSRMKMTTV